LRFVKKANAIELLGSETFTETIETIGSGNFIETISSVAGRGGGISND